MALTLRQLRMRIDVDDPLYHGMRKLKVRGRDLTNIPNSLFGLLELEVLDLSPERQSCLDYKLPEIPPAIGRLINLKVLCLDTNELLEVPPELSLLKSLERLALSNNNLTSLPAGFSDMSNLVSLHLANNDFTEFPKQICKLRNLEFLDMSDNHLLGLPEDIGDLKSLVTLLLFYNDLDKLPNSLCSLTELTCLWLGNNQIQQLPRNFGNLKKLDWSSRYTSSALDGNPLIHPPIEICRLGPVAIEKYLTSIEASRSKSRRGPTPKDIPTTDAPVSNGF